LEHETLSGSQMKDLLSSLNTQKQQATGARSGTPASPPSSSSLSAAAAAAAAAKAKGVAQPVVGS